MWRTSSFLWTKNGSIGFRSSMSVFVLIGKGTVIYLRGFHYNYNYDHDYNYTSQGDITKLAVGAIVNAANWSLLGRCYRSYN